MAKISSAVYQGDQTDHFKYLIFTNLIHCNPENILFLKLAYLPDSNEDEYRDRLQKFFKNLCTLIIFTKCEEFDSKISNREINDYKLIFINPPVGLCGFKKETGKISWGKIKKDKSIEYVDKNQIDTLLSQLSSDQTLFFYQYVRAATLNKIKETIPEYKKLFNNSKMIDVIVFPNCLFVFFSPSGIENLFIDDFYQRLKASDRLH